MKNDNTILWAKWLNRFTPTTLPPTAPPWWARQVRLPMNYRAPNGRDVLGFQLTAMWAPLRPCTVERRLETVAAWWRPPAGKGERDRRLNH